MDDHLFFVQKIWKSGRQGAWLGIAFAKAFDSTSHALLGFFWNSWACQRRGVRL